MKDICKILCNAPGVRSVDSRWPGTEDDRSFYENLDGEDWTIPHCGSRKLSRDTTGPPGSLGLLPKSIFCWVSNSEHSRNIDGNRS